MYNTGSDVLGVLIARAANTSLSAFLRERIFEPLGMQDTGFYVSADRIERLAGCYQWNPLAKRLDVYDDARQSGWREPPPFESGAGGLVSTAHDYLAFCQMLLDKGRHGRMRILSRPSVELMMSDQVTAEQRTGAELFLGTNCSWGFGGAVTILRDDLSAVPGRYGWTGGLGTSGYTDPAEQLVGILLTQRLMDSPQAPPVFEDFWTSAYAAIDD
jgi:CubicO group peptidase (beta-lactamase class C family)